MDSNVVRGFSGLIGLTVARSRYDSITKEAQLFVGIQFDQQIVGSEDDDSPVTFELKVSRAEMRVYADDPSDTKILETGQKLAGAPKRSIGARRDARVQRTKSDKLDASLSGGAASKADSMGFSKSAEEKSDTQQIGYHTSTVYDQDGNPVYVFQSLDSSPMLGAGWDGAPSIATLKYQASIDTSIKGEPTIEVSTSAKYLDIDSVFVKDEKLRKKFKKAPQKNRLIALAYLKKCVLNASHKVGDLENDFNAKCVLLSAIPQETDDV